MEPNIKLSSAVLILPWKTSFFSSASSDGKVHLLAFQLFFSYTDGPEGVDLVRPSWQSDNGCLLLQQYIVTGYPIGIGCQVFWDIWGTGLAKVDGMLQLRTHCNPLMLTSHSSTKLHVTYHSLQGRHHGKWLMLYLFTRLGSSTACSTNYNCIVTQYTLQLVLCELFYSAQFYRFCTVGALDSTEIHAARGMPVGSTENPSLECGLFYCGSERIWCFICTHDWQVFTGKGGWKSTPKPGGRF